MRLRTSPGLPMTWRSPPSPAFSSATASAASPESRVACSHSSSPESVRDATHFGLLLSGSANAAASCRPVCGQ